MIDSSHPASHLTGQGRLGRLEAALRRDLAPALLVVEDESARHAGHAGARDGGETHYRVEIVSEKFANLSRVARSRLVHELLKGEFDGGLHALSLKLRSPGEM